MAAVSTAAPAQRRGFEPNSKRRLRRPAPSPRSATLAGPQDAIIVEFRRRTFMNRMVKDTTTKAFHDTTAENLRAHVLAFLSADNLAKPLKALRWRPLSRFSATLGKQTQPCSRSTRTASSRD